MRKELSQYQNLISEINKIWNDRKLIFCGKLKKARDLEFFFKIKFSSICPLQSIKGNDSSSFIIVEKINAVEDQKCLKEYGWEYGRDYCYDDDLLQYIDDYILKDFKEGDLAIWGTGGVADYFWENCKNINLQERVKYYIDSNVAFKGTNKNGIPIITPQEIGDMECKIIIAVNYNNFYEIEQQCQELGIAKHKYVYYKTVMSSVTEMLRKTYDDDSYYNANCLTKDQNIRINGMGNIGVCCLSSDQNIMGNIYEETFEDVWNSIRAQVCRLALVNHTFTFCNRFRCPYLAGSTNEPEKADYSEEYVFNVTEYPNCIAPEIDTSCNLHCTSCRNHVYVEENRDREIYLEIIKKKIVNLPTRLLVNTVGEPFASKYCLDLIFDLNTVKRNSLSIYTNGTLLIPEKMNWLLEHYETIELAISIDAATEATYSSIRRGGNYKKLLDNIEYISCLKKQNKISYWQVNFVVQKDNVSEMEQFAKQAEEWGVDAIAMNAIENWGVYTDSEYEEVSVIKEGKIKEIYKKYFTDKLLKNPKVNLFNIASLVGAIPKYNRMM